jgi:hypothetical protein
VNENHVPFSTEIDINALLTCPADKLEQQDIFQNDKHLMNIIDSTLKAIDNRMN